VCTRGQKLRTHRILIAQNTTTIESREVKKRRGEEMLGVSYDSRKVGIYTTKRSC